MALARFVIFLFRRRNALRIHISIQGAKNSKINVTFGDFVKIYSGSITLLSGDVFKQEYIEKATENSILADVVCKPLALLGKFLLYT